MNSSPNSPPTGPIFAPPHTLSTAIITGAGSGLGRAFALRLARDGWRLALTDLDEAGGEETLRQVEVAGGIGCFVRHDVTDPEQWQALSERLRGEWPSLDLLVNNAGVGGAGEIGQFPLASWRKLVDVNLMGYVYGCHTFVDWLKQRPGKAHIVNIASFAAIASVPAMAAYNVTKAAVVSLSESLYTELRSHGVGVTVVCPVFFQTNLLENAEAMPELQRRIAAGYMRKAGFTADDVAEATMRAVARKKLFLLMGRKAQFYWRMKRWRPTWFLNAVSRGYRIKTRREKGQEG